MAYEVVFLDIAKRDISDMIDTLIEEYPDAAKRKYDGIMDVAKQLQDAPYMYEEYQFRKPYRRFIVEDYLGYYQVEEDTKTVKVYRILYYRRDTNML